MVPVVGGVGKELYPASAARGFGAPGDGGGLCGGNETVIPGGTPIAADATCRVEMP